MGPIEAVLDVLLAPVYDQINDLLPGKRSLRALTVVYLSKKTDSLVNML